MPNTGYILLVCVDVLYKLGLCDMSHDMLLLKYCVHRLNFSPKFWCLVGNFIEEMDVEGSLSQLNYGLWLCVITGVVDGVIIS